MIGLGISSQIIYFDICALVVLAIIFYSLLFRKLIVGKTNVSFIILVTCIFITTFCDTCNAFYSIQRNLFGSYKNLILRNFFLYSYFIFRNLTLPLYEIYVIISSGAWMDFKRKKWLLGLFFLPYIIDLIVLFSNFIFHNVFTIDEAYRYTRGSAALVLYIMAGIYMVLGFVILLRFRKVLPRYKFHSLFTMIPLNILAVVIQFFWPKYLIECFCTTASILLVTFTVQRPEENLDLQIGAFTMYALKEEMQKHFSLKNNVTLLVIGFKNYDVIKTILSPQDVITLKSILSECINNVKKSHHFPSDLYYFENGIYILLCPTDKKEKACSIAKIIHKRLENGVQLGKVNLHLEDSLCVLECPKDFSDYDSLSSFITRYQGFFSDIDDIIDLEKYSQHLNYKIKSDMNSIISRGIKNHGFMVYYQPIYSVEKKKFISAEALVRLKDEKWGFVSPELFIAAAEKNGTILHIGKIILEEVCKFIASPVFSSLGLEYIEINLSVAQCLQNDLVDVISGLLTKYNVKPNQLNLEITERESIFDQQVFEDNLHKLSELGISFSLDDYGTGYSNIRRIVQMPIKMVKMDKSFVDEYNNNLMQSIISNTVRMLKEIDKQIVVEGIETKEALEIFSELKCDYVQGFYFSKPLDQENFISKVKEVNNF